MASPAPQFSGVYVAAVTPHRREGYEADFAAMLELVDFLAKAGVQGICLLGSTGEFLNFKVADRARLVHLAVKRSRVPIVAGVSHSTLDGALELAFEAISSNAAGLLLMPPYFFRYTQPQIKEFYLRFAAEIGTQLPILLYNIPVFTSPIAIETARELLLTGKFAGIKDSSGDFEYASELLKVRELQPFSVLVGNDRIFTRARQAGADGVVSGVACAIPELIVALDRAIGRNASDAVEALEARLREFIDWIDRFPTPVGVKIATSARGMKAGPLAVPLPKEESEKLKEFENWFKSWVVSVKNTAARAGA
ncbi:MAG: dihydrodipicolinate synthase family protein [Acidobacteriota bacterium]|nr:dihydrodipicolinate synthase family protein [Acidobacteriota bacterium]